MPAKTFIGMQFARLLIVSRGQNAPSGKIMWNCLCDCGTKTVVSGAHLRSGHTKSCGCYNSDLTAERNTIHGKTYLPYFTNWLAMMQRCHNEKNSAYHKYGKIGIFVCEFIRSNPENLIKVLGEKPSKKHTVDRFPNQKGSYTCGSCPSCVARGDVFNVRWATRLEQQRNMSSNVIITRDGIAKCISEWSEILGIPFNTIRNRVKKGHDPFTLFSLKTGKLLPAASTV